MYTQKYLADNPPKYENLTNKVSIESMICQELTNVGDELQTLVRNIQDLNESFVGRMKRNDLTWRQVEVELQTIKNEIKIKMEYVLEKFD